MNRLLLSWTFPVTGYSYSSIHSLFTTVQVLKKVINMPKDLFTVKFKTKPKKQLENLTQSCSETWPLSLILGASQNDIWFWVGHGALSPEIIESMSKFTLLSFFSLGSVSKDINYTLQKLTSLESLLARSIFPVPHCYRLKQSMKRSTNTGYWISDALQLVMYDVILLSCPMYICWKCLEVVPCSCHCFTYTNSTFATT